MVFLALEAPDVEARGFLAAGLGSKSSSSSEWAGVETLPLDLALTAACSRGKGRKGGLLGISTAASRRDARAQIGHACDIVEANVLPLLLLSSGDVQKMQNKPNISCGKAHACETTLAEPMRFYRPIS